MSLLFLFNNNTRVLKINQTNVLFFLDTNKRAKYY